MKKFINIKTEYQEIAFQIFTKLTQIEKTLFINFYGNTNSTWKGMKVPNMFNNLMEMDTIALDDRVKDTSMVRDAEISLLNMQPDNFVINQAAMMDAETDELANYTTMDLYEKITGGLVECDEKRIQYASKYLTYRQANMCQKVVTFISLLK